MRTMPSFPGRQEGGQPEEAPGPYGCGAPPPSFLTLFDGSPGLLEIEWGAPEAVPPALESSPVGSGGETSSGAWETPLQEPPAVGGVIPTPSASAAIESSGGSASEWPETKGAPSGVSSPIPPAPQQQQWKRYRFSSEQLQTMERVFQKQNYLTIPERFQLANSLGLEYKQVKDWFQKRRSKKKHQRQQQSSLPSAPILSYNSGVPLNFSQGFSLLPPRFTPDCGLPSCTDCLLFQLLLYAPYSPSPGLSCHFPPESLMDPDIPCELD